MWFDTGRRSVATYSTRIAWCGLQLALVVASLSLLPAQAATEDGPTALETPKAQGAQRPKRQSLDDRVTLLAKELDLNEAQQLEVRKLLQAQRDQIVKLWDDTSIQPGRRVVATQAISDKTAEQIRALLNEEQKKKYIQPRKRDTQGATRPNVETWMNAVQPK